MPKPEPSASLDPIRHSLAHLLAAAVLQKFPDAKLAIGPTIENGFYYDFLLPEGQKFAPEDLKEFEKQMRKFVNQHLVFTGKKVTETEARNIFKDQPFKLELIEEFVKEGKELTVYETMDSGYSPNTRGSGMTKEKDSILHSPSSILLFSDLCRGGHVENTSEIPADGFKLDKIAGAYWRGDEKNPMLQRIYGLAFNSKKELDEYLAAREEAEKRDHKKLGPQLDLFIFSDLVGPGLPLWTPKGTLLRNLLDDFVWELRRKRGYLKVEIPHITKKELYVTSGHWDKFKDELFRIKTREGHEFAMKPMNCPHHAQIYARRQWSYRELPQRYANTTMVYRDEQTGELGGLSRVRAITQDDAHVFCRASQVKEEIFKIWDIIEEFYGAFGFKLAPRLSLHDPAHPEKYLGTPEIWNHAENELRSLVKERGAVAVEAIGEAALYGPKIDFMGKDALGREHQVATIQLDMNQPERFDLACINEKGEKERIVMIHAAIMGSIERFLSILIEHFAGAFPVWLAPVQAVVLPVSEKFSDYARKAHGQLLAAGIRAELSEADESLGKRIRAAELAKIPYVLVVGEKEEKNGSVAVRSRKGDEGENKVQDFIEKISGLTAQRAI
ncbi:MAG: threonine--tRNA ligase [Patescibacteria group bacterium]|nr:threonine--tRNA ligase [Patescibacteria group bacterium]